MVGVHGRALRGADAWTQPAAAAAAATRSARRPRLLLPLRGAILLAAVLIAPHVRRMVLQDLLVGCGQLLQMVQGRWRLLRRRRLLQGAAAAVIHLVLQLLPRHLAAGLPAEILGLPC